MEKNNYEIQVERTRPIFLTYSQEKMIEKFQLRHDDDYLYMNVLNRPYRIGRHTGVVEWSEDGFVNCTEASFNEAMTIYDVLGYSKDGCCLSGRYTTLSGMRYNQAFRSGDDFFEKYALYFDHKLEQLNQACAQLGGKEQNIGDAAWQLNLFDFLPVILQMWESDEEFPASLRILWDENILDYMHFETTFYATNFMLERIKGWMDKSL